MQQNQVLGILASLLSGQSSSGTPALGGGLASPTGLLSSLRGQSAAADVPALQQNQQQTRMSERKESLATEPCEDNDFKELGEIPLFQRVENGPVKENGYSEDEGVTESTLPQVRT